jgi:hypothetical protein
VISGGREACPGGAHTDPAESGSFCRGQRGPRAAAARSPGGPVPCRGRDGRPLPGPLPGPVGGFAAARAYYRDAVAHEPADDRTGRGPCQCWLCGRNGAGGTACPAPAPAPAAGRLCHRACDRLGASGRGNWSGIVHHRARAPRSVHQHAADRRRAAAIPRLSCRQAALDSRHHQPVRLRRRCRRAARGRRPGLVPRLAAAVLDRGRYRRRRPADVAAHLPGRPACRPQRTARRARHRPGRQRLGHSVLRCLRAPDAPLP